MSKRYHRAETWSIRHAAKVRERQYLGLDDALAGACVSNCMSSHVCSAGDSACQCSSTDNQRVLGCLSMSCSDADASSFRDSIFSTCGEAGLSSSDAASPASTESKNPRITSTRRPTRTRTNDAVTVSRTRTPLKPSDIEGEENTGNELTGTGSLTSTNLTSLPSTPALSDSDTSQDTPTSEFSSSSPRGTFFAVSSTASASAETTPNTDNSSKATSLRFTQSTKSSSSRTRSSSESSQETAGGKALPAPPSSEWQSLSLGAIVGIVVGAVAAAALIVALLVLARRRKRRRDAARVSVMRAIAPREELEKDDKADASASTPIYSMYAGRSPALQQAAGSLQNASNALNKTNMSFLDTEHSSRASKAPALSRTPTARTSRKSWTLSRKSGRSSRSKYSSRFTPKWIDMKRGSQPSNETPEFAATPSSFVLSRSFSKSGTTSYFAKLLGRDVTGFGAGTAATATRSSSHHSAEGLMSPADVAESDYSAYPPQAPRGSISGSVSDTSATDHRQTQTSQSDYSQPLPPMADHASPSSTLLPTNFIDASPNRSTHTREASDVGAETQSLRNGDRATMTRPSSVDLAWATSAGISALPPGAAPAVYTSVPFVMSAGTPGPSRKNSMNRRKSGNRRRMTHRTSTRSSLPTTPVSASSAYLSMIGAPSAPPLQDGQASVGPGTHFHTRLADIREYPSDDSLPPGAARLPSGYYIYSPEAAADSPALASSQGSSRRTSVPTPSTLNSRMGRAL